jgi:hypothetical protein
MCWGPPKNIISRQPFDERHSNTRGLLTLLFGIREILKQLWLSALDMRLQLTVHERQVKANYLVLTLPLISSSLVLLRQRFSLYIVEEPSIYAPAPFLCIEPAWIKRSTCSCLASMAFKPSGFLMTGKST